MLALLWPENAVGQLGDIPVDGVVRSDLILQRVGADRLDGQHLEAPPAVEQRVAELALQPLDLVGAARGGDLIPTGPRHHALPQCLGDVGHGHVRASADQAHVVGSHLAIDDQCLAGLRERRCADAQCQGGDGNIYWCSS